MYILMFVLTKVCGEYGPHLVVVILYLYSSAVVSFAERSCLLLEGLKCIETTRKLIIFRTLKSVLCREVYNVPIFQGPLSKVSL